MSFNAKNLTYESNEPAFLRRLRAQHGGRDSTRHERPQARPRKQLKEGDDDDEPTYVVEESQDTLSKDEYEALMKRDDDQTKEKDEAADSPLSTKPEDSSVGNSAATDLSPESSIPKEQQAAAIGASNKRRVAKVVGDEDEDVARPEEADSVQQKTKSKAKKGKKVKLSFNED